MQPEGQIEDHSWAEKREKNSWMVQSQLEKPPSVKKVILPEFTLDHVYQRVPVLSKAQLEHKQLLLPDR